jgi:hypothetical protein
MPLSPMAGRLHFSATDRGRRVHRRFARFRQGYNPPRPEVEQLLAGHVARHSRGRVMHRSTIFQQLRLVCRRKPKDFTSYWSVWNAGTCTGPLNSGASWVHSRSVRQWVKSCEVTVVERTALFFVCVQTGRPVWFQDQQNCSQAE